jgi:hypothetical protein
MVEHIGASWQNALAWAVNNKVVLSSESNKLRSINWARWARGLPIFKIGSEAPGDIDIAIPLTGNWRKDLRDRLAWWSNCIADPDSAPISEVTARGGLQRILEAIPIVVSDTSACSSYVKTDTDAAMTWGLEMGLKFGPDRHWLTTVNDARAAQGLPLFQVPVPMDGPPNPAWRVNTVPDAAPVTASPSATLDIETRQVLLVEMRAMQAKEEVGWDRAELINDMAQLILGKAR